MNYPSLDKAQAD